MEPFGFGSMDAWVAAGIDLSKIPIYVGVDAQVQSIILLTILKNRLPVSDHNLARIVGRHLAVFDGESVPIVVGVVPRQRLRLHSQV